MSKVIKYVVTDSAGIEHIFNEIDTEQDSVYNYLSIAPFDQRTERNLEYCVQITTDEFEGNAKKYTSRRESLFINPRRVDIIYDSYGS